MGDDFGALPSRDRMAREGAGGTRAARAPPSGDAVPDYGGGVLAVTRGRIRRFNISRRTEDADLGWMRRFLVANDRRLPRELGAPEVAAFLTLRAARDKLAASTQDQALGALLFLRVRSWTVTAADGAVALRPRVRRAEGERSRSGFSGSL